ncbi:MULTISPECIES: bifunctional phosphoribosylaminoimidazolecarboxamide formyltransferase/IMP cyclohydrolase [unclassified Wenzhouxiangella]|uniref:bifunctional phosphoribosylaminoimidazolecarboxamide formyltransferase/IMP cyclohydrolase n=1 Tax=unclassified Wenzhouxiangella TaxID=2613841 RepID=UPI000E32CEFB|nr:MULTISPECIES: bifunctional phosphoribosylaminoimidazolecarboxamide formyltransferase/IMP cyclohydrolase [unclassified Wenzhouxiangella]RFF26587.1 bifunctional phosphoribosylaminoimidazolecarboxamide formyltransferase/IMP cyclohydrolase PurH [Wenzhouxiangella sp. 15181]RFP70202.1 bifunctional phosphoribosylaminoimidazolecarboxamide formyltransferase/IMP cyclohydrolase PurH [Wenzhouxiangella sp. 15190]
MNESNPRWALLSVSDKRGLVELARRLEQAGFGLLSTGGTAGALTEAGLTVTEVSELSGFPEIMGGRVKTLNPKIHGGILGRRDSDVEVMKEHGIDRIDVVVVNLYPFAETVARPDCTLEEAVENIDIGGPALLRAAAKNHRDVCVLCDPDDYSAFIESLPELPDERARRELATRAFAHTCTYDGQISQWLSDHDSDSELPPRINLALDAIQPLRYGENPHQAAGVYRVRGQGAHGLAGCQPLQGKGLSYNNLLDADAAWAGVRSLGEQAACVIVKHTNPCGAAQGDSIAEAYDKAFACDPTSAFGGIIAVNREVDAELAARLLKQFMEVLIAPSVSAQAREMLAAKPNVRVLTPGDTAPQPLELHAIDGGWLVQSSDDWQSVPQLEIVTERAPDDAELDDLRFAWAAVRLVRSNAIVYAKDRATVGIGAGQMSRVDSARFAALKAEAAGLSLEGAVMASDAFFPFADSIEAAAERGIRAVIQPGGSKRDQEVIDACNNHGIAMVLTGRRHFRH